MTTPTPFADSVTHALIAAGATVVTRCATCGEWHEGECPFAQAGAMTPYVTTISADGGEIQDGVPYDGVSKPQFVLDDDRAGVVV